MVTCRAWTHFWLNEGFATFMAAALSAIRRLPPPPPSGSGTLLAAEAQAAATSMRLEIGALERELAEFRWLKRRWLFRTLLRIAALRHRPPFRWLLAPLQLLPRRRS